MIFLIINLVPATLPPLAIVSSAAKRARLHGRSHAALRMWRNANLNKASVVVRSIEASAPRREMTCGASSCGSGTDVNSERVRWTRI